MRSRIAENIMSEYRRKQRYEQNKKWAELRKFEKENCVECKNKNTDLCEIKKNIAGKLQCINKK